MSNLVRPPRQSTDEALRISLGRQSLRVLGVFFFVLGSVGVVVPLLPTTIFWILAVYCFGRSSPALRERIINHPRLGTTIQAYVDHGVISRTSKRTAVIGIFGSFLISAYCMDFAIIPTTAVLSLLLAVVAYILSRPEGIPS